MAPFLQLLLNDGKWRGQPLLKASAIRRMETAETTLAARRGLHYGYGFGNYQWLRDGRLFHGHGGDADGYLAHFGYQRDAGLGYFIVINAFSHRPLRAMRALVERTIIAPLPRPSEPDVATLPPARLASFLGKYAPATWRFRPPDADTQLHVFARADTLYTRLNDRAFRDAVPDRICTAIPEYVKSSRDQRREVNRPKV